MIFFFFFFSSRRRHTRLVSDWSSDVCSSDLEPTKVLLSTLVVSCPLPGLLWLAEAWSVIIERVSLSVLCDPMPGRWGGALDRADTPLHDRPSPSAEHQIKLTGLA